MNLREAKKTLRDRLPPRASLLRQSLMNKYNDIADSMDWALDAIDDIKPGEEFLVPVMKKVYYDLTNASNAITHAIPQAVCVYCPRQAVASCPACSGRGWITKQLLDNASEHLIREAASLPS